MKRHIKILLTATLIVLPALSVAAQGDSIARRGNALDHLLQRRPARQGFGETDFRDHTFLSASLGTSFLFTPDERASSSFSPAGFSAAVAFGKWFTPLSGARLGVGIGTNRNVLDRRYAYARLSLDYMLNISALASGYDYDRPFEVIGLAGADWMAVRHVGADQWGGHLALQLKWHVSPLVDIYLEPKYGILSDGADGISGWRGYDTQGAVSLGLTYNMVPDDRRAKDAEWGGTFLDGTFVTAGVGVMTLVSGINDPGGILSSARPAVTAGVGKWFNPSSALRLGFYGGYAKAGRGHLKAFGARLDYLLNMNAVFGGYDPSRRFELLLVAGLETTLRKEVSATEPMLGAGLGLQGDVQLSGGTSLYIEPRLSIYGSDFSPSSLTVGGIDALASLSVGLNFMRLPSEQFVLRGQRTFRRAADNLFFSVGAGVQTLLQHGPGGGVGQLVSPVATAAVGKWFTSVSGLRLSGSLGYLEDDRTARGKGAVPVKSYMGTLGLDYLFNFSLALWGYDPDRLFETSGVAGAVLAVKSNGQSKCNVGLNVGLHGLFNLGGGWGVWLEPSLRLFKRSFTYGHSFLPGFDAYASLTAGAAYRFGGSRATGQGASAGAGRNFVIFNAGASGLLNLMARGGVCGYAGYDFRLGYGRRLTAASAVRVVASIDNARQRRKREAQFAGASVEYVLDMTALARGRGGEGVFSFTAFGGPSFGAAFGGGRSAFVPGVTGGVGFGFAVGRSLSFTVEPRATLHGRRYYIHSSGGGNPALKVGVDAGVAWRF